MGSSMMKTTLREIRQSLGRYLAIMAIVALGVGLFCGLKVTRDVMVKSAQQYFEERQLYDISLLSTVGFDTDVAKQLSRREKVLDAQGAVSTDALLLDAQGKESALKVYSLLDQQNLPVLVSGRMPQNAQECVVDAQAFGKDAVGTMLTLSENNEEDTEELFAHKQFHVVGTVNSPYYANYERGTTSLGNGTIRGFMLVLKDTFDCDYDTEIFVRLNTGGAAIYSEEYDAQIDEVESWLEDFAQQKADERYQRLKADGEEELYASRQQLLSQTQKNQLELEACLRELAGQRPRLLLHSCCAPCSSYVLEYLSTFFESTVGNRKKSADFGQSAAASPTAAAFTAAGAAASPTAADFAGTQSGADCQESDGRQCLSGTSQCAGTGAGAAVTGITDPGGGRSATGGKRSGPAGACPK